MNDLDILKNANPMPTTQAPAPPDHLAESIMAGDTIAVPRSPERKRNPLLVAVAAALTVVVGIGGLALATRERNAPVANQPTTSVPSLTGNAPPDNTTPPTTVIGIVPDVVAPVECSATGASPLQPDPSLPAAVDAMRLAIGERALSCDYAGLAALTTPSTTYSFGGGSDPGGFWRESESRGGNPMLAMVTLLTLPATIEEYDATSEAIDFERRNLILRLDGLGGLTDSVSERIDGLGDALSAAETEEERFAIAAELSVMEQELENLLGQHDRIEERLAELDTIEGLARYYSWPPAFAYDSWDEVPEAERQQIAALYTDQDLESFDQFGSYAGWRIGITEGGAWLFFVAGD
ncbi:MAG: hypothetical protein KJO18_11420 [Acidimicrobiia bacterium]|nr:hypothetical protein [Acidimicrobiia bacterium]